MALYTGCIYTNSHRGTRISVMSPPAPRNETVLTPPIAADSFDQWWRELSPPPDLAAEYHSRQLPWEKFQKVYIRYLRQTTAKHVVRNLALWALAEDFTLLCVESTAERCHRRILAEECRKKVGSLEIVIG